MILFTIIPQSSFFSDSPLKTNIRIYWSDRIHQEFVENLQNFLPFFRLQGSRFWKVLKGPVPNLMTSESWSTISADYLPNIQRSPLSTQCTHWDADETFFRWVRFNLLSPKFEENKLIRLSFLAIMEHSKSQNACSTGMPLINKF